MWHCLFPLTWLKKAILWQSCIYIYICLAPSALFACLIFFFFLIVDISSLFVVNKAVSFSVVGWWAGFSSRCNYSFSKLGTPNHLWCVLRQYFFLAHGMNKTNCYLTLSNKWNCGYLWLYLELQIHHAVMTVFLF